MSNTCLSQLKKLDRFYEYTVKTDLTPSGYNDHHFWVQFTIFNIKIPLKNDHLPTIWWPLALVLVVPKLRCKFATLLKIIKTFGVEISPQLARVPAHPQLSAIRPPVCRRTWRTHVFLLRHLHHQHPRMHVVLLLRRMENQGNVQIQRIRKTKSLPEKTLSCKLFVVFQNDVS